MSITDTETANRQRQQDEIAEVHRKEAVRRPNALHRAVVFLLKEQALNNRDTAGEAKHHIAELDAKHSAAVAELDKADEESGPARTSARFDSRTKGRTRSRKAASAAAADDSQQT